VRLLATLLAISLAVEAAVHSQLVALPIALYDFSLPDY
jgi:hypothetical protein